MAAMAPGTGSADETVRCSYQFLTPCRIHAVNMFPYLSFPNLAGLERCRDTLTNDDISGRSARGAIVNK